MSHRFLKDTIDLLIAQEDEFNPQQNQKISQEEEEKVSEWMKDYEENQEMNDESSPERPKSDVESIILSIKDYEIGGDSSFYYCYKKLNVIQILTLDNNRKRAIFLDKDLI